MNARMSSGEGAFFQLKATTEDEWKLLVDLHDLIQDEGGLESNLSARPIELDPDKKTLSFSTE